MKLDVEATKAQMGRKFLNGKELAAAIGISTTSMYKILRGERQPKFENLRKMCEVLECDPDQIVEEWQ